MGWVVDGGGVVGGFMRWVGGWWGGWLEGSWGGWWWGGWRVHWVGAYTHPPMNSYNVRIFNFMNTHPPTIEHIQSVTLSLYILWRVHEVGGGGVVGVFMGCVVVWVVVGWVVGEFMGG